jgi:hypothetical protein
MHKGCSQKKIGTAIILPSSRNLRENHIVRKLTRVTKGMGHVMQSGMTQETVLLCRNCHLTYHQYAKS